MIAVLIDPVTKAHQLAFFHKSSLHPIFNGHLSSSAVTVDVLEHLHRHLVCATMQRPLQCANSTAHSAVHVGLGACDHARSESAGVEIMFCIENKADIHDPCCGRIWLLARNAPEEIRRMIERCIRSDWILAFKSSLADTNDRWNLCK